MNMRGVMNLLARLLLAGAWLVAPTWPRAVFGVVTRAYVLVGLRLEEQKLRVAFGPAYQAYQQRVPALWPRWSGKKRVHE